MPDARALIRQLEEDGIALLPNLLSGERLRGMQIAFDARLKRPRWNHVDGYEKTERYRHMVQDVLTLDQGFVDVALHPLVKETLHGYLGDAFALVEAKGWKSLPTAKDFHGWHGDAWYDQERLTTIPREVKLAVYLTDVSSGAFHYAKGTQGKEPPRGYRSHEMAGVSDDRVAKMTGPAGTAFLFDTSGIHRQSMPILERRHAVFLNYHDPSLPLQREDVEYYRYHPLMLNAAYLGGLSADDARILGFGEKSQYIHAHERRGGHEGFQHAVRVAFDLKTRIDDFRSRVSARVRRLAGATAARLKHVEPLTTAVAASAVGETHGR